MNIKRIKFFVYIILILFYVNSLQAIPLPFPPNISIKDLIKYGKKAIEKNRDDKNAQEEYQKTLEELNTDVDKNKENLDVLNQKNELRKRFNGNWSGELVLKKENQLDISCKIKIIIKNFEGKLKSKCEDINFTVYLFINLDRNLEKSFILTSLRNEKLKLLGDITSFVGNSSDIYVRGSLMK
jgi:hypothetical protein